MNRDNTQHEKMVMMTTAPVRPLIRKLAFPTIVSMLITSVYTMADAYFVGKINNSATGAVGVVFSVMSIIQALGFFFGMGSGNAISRMLGSEDVPNAEKMAATGFFSSLLCGGMLTALGLIFLEPICYLLGATPTILPYATQYLSVILIGAPYVTASFVLNNQLRFQGNAFYAMVGIAVGSILNIGLDPLFIFTFGLGIRGAAIATIIGQLVSFVLLWRGVNHSDNLNIRLKNFSPSRTSFLDITRGGAPSLARQGLASLSIILLNRAANPYGDAVIAAMTVVNRVTFFAFAAVIGFGQGFQPVCGFNFGAKRFDRVREAFRYSLQVSIGVLLVASVVGALLAPALVSIFRNDPQVIHFGAIALRFQCLSLPLVSIVIMSNMLFQSTGKLKEGLIVASARQGLVLVPLLLLLPPLIGVSGVLCAQCLSDFGAFAITLPLLMKEWKLLGKEPPAKTQTMRADQPVIPDQFE